MTELIDYGGIRFLDNDTVVEMWLGIDNPDDPRDIEPITVGQFFMTKDSITPYDHNEDSPDEFFAELSNLPHAYIHVAFLEGSRIRINITNAEGGIVSTLVFYLTENLSASFRGVFFDENFGLDVPNLPRVKIPKGQEDALYFTQIPEGDADHPTVMVDFDNERDGSNHRYYTKKTFDQLVKPRMMNPWLNIPIAVPPTYYVAEFDSSMTPFPTLQGGRRTRGRRTRRRRPTRVPIRGLKQE
jgi:hypothetical protein